MRLARFRSTSVGHTFQDLQMFISLIITKAISFRKYSSGVLSSPLVTSGSWPVLLLLADVCAEENESLKLIELTHTATVFVQVSFLAYYY